MSDNPIHAEAIVETEYGEKVALQSPFDAKDFIKAMPFMEYESYDDYTAELQESGIPDGAINAVEDYDFSPDFATHRSWNPTVFGPESGGWVVDVESFDETRDFLEHCGFEVEVSDEVDL